MNPIKRIKNIKAHYQAQSEVLEAAKALAFSSKVSIEDTSSTYSVDLERLVTAVKKLEEAEDAI